MICHSIRSGLFGNHLGPYGFVLPPLNFLFTRDNIAWIYGGVTLNPMYWAARKPETLLTAAIYRFHPTFSGRSRCSGDPLRTTRRWPPWKAATSCRSAMAPCWSAWNVHPPGNWAVGQYLFERGTVDRVVPDSCKSRAAVHLDTVFTFCGGNVVYRLQSWRPIDGVQVTCVPARAAGHLTFSCDPCPMSDPGRGRCSLPDRDTTGGIYTRLNVNASSGTIAGPESGRGHWP